MNGAKKKCSQNTIIVLCWLVYTFAYLGRYSYNANISLIMEDFHINHAQAGIVTTCFFFAYGIGQVVNGMFCTKTGLSQRNGLHKYSFCDIPFFILDVFNIEAGDREKHSERTN